MLGDGETELRDVSKRGKGKERERGRKEKRGRKRGSLRKNYWGIEQGALEYEQRDQMRLHAVG